MRESSSSFWIARASTSRSERLSKLRMRGGIMRRALAPTKRREIEPRSHEGTKRCPLSNASWHCRALQKRKRRREKINRLAGVLRKPTWRLRGPLRALYVGKRLHPRFNDACRFAGFEA